MKTYLIVILSLLGFILHTSNATSQELVSCPNGAGSVGLGGVITTIDGFWATHANPAGLTSLKSISFGAQYQNHFLTKDINTQSFALATNTRSGNIGMSYAQFGYSLYREQKIGLTYAKGFGGKFSAGLRFDYFSTKISREFGNASAYTFELGFQARLSERFMIAGHTLNPVGVKRSKDSDEDLNTTFAFGVLADISEEIQITSEVYKDLLYEPLLRGGIRYMPKPVIFTSIGFSTLPARVGSDKFTSGMLYTFGFGARIKSFTLDVAAGLHPGLGWTPTASVVFNFPEKISKTQ